MDFRNWILERFTPCVMVIASPEAEAMCQKKNGVTVVDLLRPFGFFHHLSVPVRTVGEQPYRIKQFGLRFFEPATMHAPPLEVAEEHLKAVLTATAQNSGAEDNVNLMAAMRKGELPRQTPWFEKFEHEFMRMLAFSDLEIFDHPVACLLVLHSHADNLPAAFQKLHTSAEMPPLMKMGMMEGNVLRHYLLLHDDSTAEPGALQRAEEEMRRLHDSLGSSSACHLVRLNSGAGDAKEAAVYEGLFKAHMQPAVPGGGAGEPAAHPRPPGKGIGSSLADSDLRALTSFLEDFSIRSLLPHLETRMRTLYHQVLATRKGVRNQIKNLLWRSKSSGSDLPRAAAAAGPAFGAQSVEGQLRQLADLAFLMQDYETCLSTLRLLASDLKADKDWRHYAAAQEMLGLAAFMAGNPMGDVVGHFREAFARYDGIAGRSGRDLRRYATRSQLLLAEYCCQHSLFGEANAALMRAQTQEGNLIAAVLLEQAALYLLHVDPPSVRKWAFHLVLAALRFANCQQPQLANRAYRQVLGVFNGREWGHIDSHLQDMLGRHAAETGDFEAAASHFAATLACTEAHPNRQRQLLEQFLKTLRRLTPEQVEKLAYQLPLPAVDLEHMDVSSDDAFTFANADARSYPEAFWKRLAAPLLAGQDTVAATWLDGGKKSGAAVPDRVAVVGEEIGLDVDMHNPLALELHVSRLQASVEASTAGSFQAVEEDVTLRGGERMRVRLKFRGLQAGLLKVTGLSWQLEGLAKGCKALQVHDLPQLQSRGRSKQAESEASLAFTVIPAMPRLQVEMGGLEGPVYEGELVRCIATLRNTGALPLQSLRLLIAQPDLLCCPSQAHLATSLAAPSDFAVREEEGPQLTNGGSLVRGGSRLLAWLPELSIAPGDELQWPFFLHPQQAGQLALQCVWQYVASPLEPSMPWRVLRWSHTVDVLPLLQLQPSILPSPADLDRCLLRIHASSAEGAHAVELQEVACSSNGWGVDLLADTQLGRSSSTSSTGSVRIDTALPAGSQANFICQLYMPTQQQQSHHPGVMWLAEGPIAHFLSERRRLMHSPAPLPRGSSDLPAAQSSAPVSSITTAHAPANPALEAQLGDSTPAADERQADSIDLVLGWRIAGTLGRPDRAGVYYMLDTKCQESAMLPAVVVGRRRHRWDFSQGPFQAQLLLKTRNHRRIAASLCCEAGTSLDLHSPELDRAEARRWHMKPQAELPPGAASVPGTPSSRGPSSSGGPESARTSPASTPRPTGTPLSGDLLPAGCASSSGPLWTGQTRASIPHLEPGAIAEVPLQVLMFGPGQYQLTDYALFWTFLDGSMNSAQLGPPILLDIEQM